MNKTICFTVLMLLILASCGKGKNDADNGIKFITDWEYDSPLSEDESFQCDEIGVDGIKAVDSVVVVSHRLNWSILSSDGKRKYADFLSIGQGPGEFSRSVPDVETSYFITKGDSVEVYIPNNKRKKIVKVNLTDILTGGKGGLTERPAHPSFRKAWYIVMCDSTSAMVSTPNDSITGLSKFLWSGDSIAVIKGTETMDALRVKSKDNINLLSSFTLYNELSGNFVEMKAFLNWINIFPKEGGRVKTILIGPRQFDLAKLDEKGINYDERAFHVMAAWDKGFGVISSEGLVNESRPVLSDSSDLLVFDWDGDPIYRTKLPLKINSFDIDWGNGRLIVHDEVNDRVLAYDATPIIERFE